MKTDSTGNSRAIRKVLAGLIVLLATAAFTPVMNAQQNTAQSRTADPNLAFVLGNLEFILLHELAHVLIADLDIPIVASEESAADYIATLALLGADRFDEATGRRARQYLFATANGLAGSWESAAGAGTDIQYWGSHALTIQRFYQIICLVYGSNPDEFSELPGRVGMPAERSALCSSEHARAARALDWLFENYGRRDSDPPGADVGLVFEPAPSQVSQRIADALIADGMLDRTIARLKDQFTLPEPLRIAFRSCRARQAAWIADQREIRVCYALLDAYFVLGLSQNGPTGQSGVIQP